MSEQVIGVEDLVGRYRGAGKLDSSGSFTLDSRKALEKLASFALPSLYHWVLKVIQSLHRSRASQIDVMAGVLEVKIVSDGVLPSFNTIDDLLAHLLMEPGAGDPALRHLAMGLQGCLAVKPYEVRLSLTDSDKVRRFILRSGGWRDEVVEQARSGSQPFELILSRSVRERLGASWFAANTDILDMLFRRPKAYDRENAIIYESCSYAACRVTLAGRLVSQRNFGEARYPGYVAGTDSNGLSSRLRSLLSGRELIGNAAVPGHHIIEYLTVSGPGGGFRLTPTSEASLSNRLQLGDQLGNLSRAYAIRMELSRLARIVFIEDGVVIDSLLGESFCPGLVVLADAAHLRKDLTSFKVIKTSELEDFETEVRAMGDQLARRVAQSLDLMPAPELIRSILLLPKGLA